jgi:S-formylglutathione hydrolase
MTLSLDAFTTLSEHRCFGGTQSFHSHDSREVGLPMRFSVFLPPQAAYGPVPALVYLAGLTCNEETFPIKAGAQRLAAELGLALVAPDTSPRGAQVPGESESWDFGVGAGFYLDATEPPWATHWRMESYLMDELVPALSAHLPIDPQRLGILGHSMGGHGALTLALRHPGVFRSLSAMAPICAPTRCAWGEKAFTGYLGADRAAWADHDAIALLERQPAAPYPGGILVDQGTADKFLAAGQLHPDLLETACERIGQPLSLRRHEGYDHGYYFIQSVIGDHLAHHARALGSHGPDDAATLAATTMAASA